MASLNLGVVIIEGIVAILSVFGGIVGNLLVVIVILRGSPLHTISSVYVCSLAISDLCMALTNSPLFIVSLFQPELTVSTALCQPLGFCYIAFRLSSVFSLALIGIERCISIQSPLHYNRLLSPLRTVGIISCAYVLASIFATVPLVITTTTDDAAYMFSPVRHLCVPYKLHWYKTSVLVCGVGIPMLTVLAAYACIAKAALRQAARESVVCDQNHCRVVPSRLKQLKAVRNLAIITGKVFSSYSYRITSFYIAKRR